ncbi:MAG: hypothetical protein KGL58_05205, partial [Pseudomonadota bacterium]|nr:hypothetical protein [Pseudomonadota bacterium]
MTLSTFLPRLDRRFTNWLGISFLIHFLIILGIGIQVPSPHLKQALSPTLEIMLVNGKSSSTPHHANALAQVNLEGGGNTDTHTIAKSPFPANHPISPKKIQKEEKKVRELEKELHTLLAISKMNENNEIRPANNPAPHNPSRHSGLSPNPQTLKIRSLEAQISREVVAYEQRPRRQFIGARTRQYRFARYIERWRTR